MATTYTLEIIQGNSLNLQINATNSDGSYINLSGYGARGQIRYSYGSTGVLLDLQPTIGTPYVSGIININLPATGTAALPVGTFVYDLEITGSNGYCLKYLKGYAPVSPEATR